MAEYIVKRYNDSINQNDEIYKHHNKLQIDNFPWDNNNYKPLTEGVISYTDTMLKVMFTCYEKNIKVSYFKQNDPVYKDSCVEFFFMPEKENENRYMNFEINAAGTLLLGFGEDRNNRSFLDVDSSIFNIKASLIEKDMNDYNGQFWTIEYSIPFDFLESFYGKLSFKSGDRLKANCYKCGDDTEFPHYGCWSNITCEKGDFHRPDYFGEMILE